DLRLSLPDRARQPVIGRPPLVEILKGVTLAVGKGETLGIVGESGSGKSTLARSMVRIYRPTAGRLVFEGKDITTLGEPELRPLRARLQIVFQDSQSSLNPRLTVGTSIVEPLLAFGRAPGRREGLEIAAGLLGNVGLPPDYLHRYPHQ